MFADIPHDQCSLSLVICSTYYFLYLMTMWQRIRGYFYNEMRYINLCFPYLVYLQEINVILPKGQ